jgi:hypothetical protein
MLFLANIEVKPMTYDVGFSSKPNVPFNSHGKTEVYMTVTVDVIRSRVTPGRELTAMTS